MGRNPTGDAGNLRSWQSLIRGICCAQAKFSYGAFVMRQGSCPIDRLVRAADRQRGAGSSVVQPSNLFGASKLEAGLGRRLARVTPHGPRRPFRASSAGEIANPPTNDVRMRTMKTASADIRAAKSSCG